MTALAHFVDAFAKRAEECVAARGRFTCALTGGSAATLWYPALANRSLPWDHMHFYLSDERCVPAEHPDSTARLIRLALPMAQLYPVDTALPPEEAAAEYARRLPPKFDCIHLGRGPDGHVASLFPGHALLLERSLHMGWLSDAPKPPPVRVSMTLPKLCSAAEVWFLVLGDNKQAAVDAARNDSHSQLPAALVQRGAARTQWFLEKLF